MTEKLSNPTQILGALGDFGPSEYQPKHRRELVFENEVEFEELPELNPTRARHMGARALRNYIPTFASETFSPKHRAELKHKAERGVTIEQTTEDHSIESEHALITDDKEILGQSRHLRREMYKTTRDTVNAIHEGYINGRKIAETPRTTYLKWRAERTDLKANRLERSLVGRPDTRRNRRLRKDVEILRNRAKWRRENVDLRAEKHQKRVNSFARLTDGELEGKKQLREKRYQEKIDRLVHKKIQAMRGKKYNKTLNEAKINRLHPRKRMEYVQGLSEAEKKQLTADAISVVRDENIKKGILKRDYTVHRAPTMRKIDEYERAVR